MHCNPIKLRSYPIIISCNPTNLNSYPKNGATADGLGITSVASRMASIDNGEAFKDNRIAIKYFRMQFVFHRIAIVS